MPKPIRDILMPDEARRLEEIQSDMGDPHLGAILENVLHIECGVDESSVKVVTYESPTNPYEYIRYIGREQRRKPTDEELYERRAQHLVHGSERKHIIMHELKIRTEHIIRHKWFLSEIEKYDVGLILASACWLKQFSEEFYAKSEEDYGKHGKDFEWSGMERAVVIAAPNKKGEKAHYVLVRNSDLMYEANIAQYAGGVARPNSDINKTAGIAREKLTEIYQTEHFCLLNDPKPFEYPRGDVQSLNPPAP